MKLKLIAGCLLIVIAATAGTVVVIRHSHRHPVDEPSKSPVRSLVDLPTLRTLPLRDVSSASTARLAPGVQPPTNSWMSGMALQSTPLPVFPMPESFLAKPTGFEIGLPTVKASADLIAGEHTAGISADLGATDFRIIRADKLSTTLRYVNGTARVAEVTVVEGSPYIFLRAAQKLTVHMPTVNTSDITHKDAHYLTYRNGGKTYVVVTARGIIGQDPTGLQITANSGDLITFYALPGNDDPLREYAGNEITSTGVSYQQTTAGQQTTLSYETANHQPTVLATMPYQDFSGFKPILHYQSIWGSMQVESGNRFTQTASTVQPASSLSLAKLSGAQRKSLEESLSQDVSSTTIDKQDSYYAGKQLGRAANLLDIAEQLHQTSASDTLKQKLRAAFSQRLNGKYFYYDTRLKGIAADTAGFGSQDFNDHHFHYGYWLYAAAILSKYDPSFVQQYGQYVDLLAADIANDTPSANFPQYRYYDPYAGHAWAAGLAPFADGNNQESSSEAIHAWNGVSLWGQVTHNEPLQSIGKWMLANEAQTAAKAWRSVNTSQSGLQGYTSPVASLNFGGKRTYATFFSDAPNAKLGIQLIPMDPSMQVFGADGPNISRKIDSSIADNDYNVPLGDYILMYRSLADASGAATSIARQTMIDDGDSMTYLQAFILSQQK